MANQRFASPPARLGNANRWDEWRRDRVTEVALSVARGHAQAAVVDTTVVRPDGSRIPVEIRYTPWHGPDAASTTAATQTRPGQKGRLPGPG